jgi:hypothetical protein
MPCCSGIQGEANLYGHLPVRDLIILQMAANFRDLKPLHISDRLGRSRDRVVDCVIYAVWRGSNQLDLLVDVVTHGRIKPLSVAAGEQISGSKSLRVDRLQGFAIPSSIRQVPNIAVTNDIQRGW